MSAVISECGLYRYRLERQVSDTGKVYGFFGVNPSTADAETDDQTVRKWTGFVRMWGGSKFIVGNVFAYRATDVNTLGTVNDPIGPFNPGHLINIAYTVDILVPCWGSRDKLPLKLRPAFDSVLSALFNTGKPVMSFGRTKSGDPCHPLMIGYNQPLVQLNREN